MSDISPMEKFEVELEAVEREIADLRESHRVQAAADFSKRIIDLEYKKMTLQNKVSIERKKTEMK